MSRRASDCPGASDRLGTRLPAGQREEEGSLLSSPAQSVSDSLYCSGLLCSSREESDRPEETGTSIRSRTMLDLARASLCPFGSPVCPASFLRAPESRAGRPRSGYVPKSVPEKEASRPSPHKAVCCEIWKTCEHKRQRLDEDLWMRNASA